MVSIVVAMHDEEPAIDAFFREVDAVLDALALEFEYVCVNDGSTDRTLNKLLERQARDARIRIVDLTRNFGKEAAMMAGMERARGDAVILIDADLQDPPAHIREFVEHWQQGYEVIYGVRTSRRADTATKRVTASMFYKMFNTMSEIPIPENAGDFRLMDRKAVDALLRLPERNRFTKGLYAWIGFRQIGIPFERPERVAGTSSWGYFKLFNFAIDALTSFSILPLRVASILGGIISLMGIAYAFYLVVRTIAFGIDVPGYASIMVAILFLGGIQMLGIGIVGEYIGRLYLEAKNRPIYLAANVYEAPAAPAADQRDGPKPDLQQAKRTV
ncbi:MAG TPA: glycosyltransferase family 2 protein [Rhizomicrobium sp.]|nr:glycosyltransferase family 2 protein [Rhizomicrobium sp.]